MVIISYLHCSVVDWYFSLLLITMFFLPVRSTGSLRRSSVATGPLPSQVIKSATIRKRQSTGMILSKVVQQMNVKLGGPLWHVLAEEEQPFEELFKGPTMILAIHSSQMKGETWLGLVASLDKQWRLNIIPWRIPGLS